MKRPAVVNLALLRRWPLPRLDPAGGKTSRGTLLVAGGSDTVPGAVTLAGLAGLRAGAGVLQVATTSRAAMIVAGQVPEAKVIPLPTRRDGELAPAATAKIRRLAADGDAIVIGPGSAARHLAAAITGPACWVVDAAAIAGFARLPARPAAVVLTPHVGEMAELCDLHPTDVASRSIELVRAKAAELGCVIALKGAITYIASPDGELFASRAGNHGLGTSGSGDVLAGLIAGLAARGADPLQAAVWGVHLHGRAGDALARRIGPLGYLARELLDEIPRQLAIVPAPRTRERRRHADRS